MVRVETRAGKILPVEAVSMRWHILQFRYLAPLVLALAVAGLLPAILFSRVYHGNGAGLTDFHPPLRDQRGRHRRAAGLLHRTGRDRPDLPLGGRHG